ncbi:bifunctional alpha/beta hydrolase/class I SAM-dependent methyltransferase [Massilia sp. H6]|uniref:bifunctional alpha/beta hydrolase/class I SAM-dependent methyltransferase n=1 Tax=Massilia sp. H6 TaxID=2970464 RepID=UPI002168DE50|nr:bifunctional alpha/beta hydrolase/class I SAM-dependent methyltransferase [Massilia sp. H6]UVW27252.1 bifunctional alpha/beta hydrolase/class I SAM-dependent methyltransferase [Massilia sp. H6]
MEIERQITWVAVESGFDARDGTRLFYRAWRPRSVAAGRPARALIFLHRGHEHSGRIAKLVERFGLLQDWAFAYDNRGHGYSPGERGDAPDFATLVRDLDTFVRHVESRYGIATENMIVVANSVGAVVAATWVHDYAPRIRGLVMAAAAFSIKLYVPFAKSALRFARCFKPDLFVTSYIRPGMLTHCDEEAQAYAADPLIAKSISAKILLELADVGQRIIENASAISVPVLMLVAEKDYVVSETPQRRFFDRLGTHLKRYVKLTGCYHAVFYERDTSTAIQASLDFIEACFATPLLMPKFYADAHRSGPAARAYAALERGESVSSTARAWFGVQRRLLCALGPLSNGMHIGMTHGFDSGESLDYVYRNQAGGKLGIGKLLDRAYLDAVGWRGVRVRKAQLQHMLAERIAAHPCNEPLRILDIAAGSARYVLETVKRFQEHRINVSLRDYMQHNVDNGRRLAADLQLQACVAVSLADAFDGCSYQGQENCYDIAIVSGLYELFSDNDKVSGSLRSVVRSLRPGGYLIYTAQPWHPQLNMIAYTLTNHCGVLWKMRPRPQAEMDALVTLAGARKLDTAIGVKGIFTVSLARKDAAPDAVG